MGNLKTIFVTGASGRQGGAVAAHLLKNGFSVKAFVRNPESPSLESLKKLNAEIIRGDLNNTATYSDHVKNADGVFCALTYKYGTDTEAKQGIALANLAKDYGIRHFLYSSVVGANLHTGIAHWESKFKVESHIKEIGLPYTIIRPSSFYENFLIPQVKKRLLKGSLPSPINKEAVQQFISTDDIGKISTAIFMNPDKYIGKTFAIAAEQMSMSEVANVFSEALSRPVKYQKIPGLIVRLALGKNVYKMLKWVNENDGVFVKDLYSFKKEFPGLMSLKKWINSNFK